MTISLMIGIALATAHLVLVVIIVRSILAGVEPAWPMLWLLLFWIDFPFSLIFLAIAKVRHRFKASRLTVPMLRAPINDFDNFVMPFCILGVGGTGWWYLLPQLIARMVA